MANTTTKNEVYNPKTDFVRSVNKFRFSDVTSPIDAQIKDVGELEHFWKSKYGRIFVPYAGNNEYTSHSLVSLLSRMNELSTTFGACSGKIKSYCFGGKIEILKRVNPDFDLKDELDLPKKDTQLYYEFFKENFELLGVDQKSIPLSDFNDYCYDERDSTGDLVIEVILINILGKKKVKVQVHSNENWLYAPKKNDDHIVFSKHWTAHWLSKHPPTFLPLYPKFSGTKQVQRTVLHFKGKNTRFYSRPKWIGGFMPSFFEAQQSDYLIKQVKSRFMGDGFVEFEDEDPTKYKSQGNAYDGIQKNVRNNFTVDSDNPDPLWITTRGFGSASAMAFQFKPNTDSSFYKQTKQDARLDIIAAKEFTPGLLLGNSNSKGWSANVFLDELKTAFKPTMFRLQKDHNKFIDKWMTIGIEFLDKPEFNECSFSLTSPFAKDLKSSENESDANVGVGSGEV